MKELSKTWTVFRIGDTVYSMNESYITGVINLSKLSFQGLTKSSAFICGIYNAYNVNMPLLDGRKILGIKTIEEDKIQFIQNINEVKLKHRQWLDSLEWALVTKDKFAGEMDPTKCYLGNWINTVHFDDSKLDLNVSKINEPHRILHSMASRAISLSDGGSDEDQIKSLISEIRRQSVKYIIKGLDTITEIHNSAIDTPCIIVNCKNTNFAITVDEIIGVFQQDSDARKIYSDRLSAGIVPINEKEYTVFNLTKLIRVIRMGI